MQKLLQQAGINHSRDVETYLASLKERLLHRHSARPIHPPQLALVAAELSTRSKLRFPEMAELIWREEASVHPAKWVRASMSIPGFFHPLKQKIPHFASKRAQWSEWTGYRGEALQEATLVDGGLISNFPIHVFHRNEVPERPTFGIRLNNDRAVAQSIDSISALAGSSLSTARQFFDYDFLHKNPDYTQLIGYIHTGAYDWLDFNLSLEAKKDLFLRGVRAADAFLRRFDWARYKKLRARLLEQ
jgi:NTE family protein